MTAYIDHYSIGIEGEPERDPHAHIRLWTAALGLLLDDAAKYWLEKPLRLSGQLEEGQQAFDDVVSCGPMLRRCCQWLEWEPEWITERFLRWCDGVCAA